MAATGQNRWDEVRACTAHSCTFILLFYSHPTLISIPQHAIDVFQEHFRSNFHRLTLSLLDLATRSPRSTLPIRPQTLPSSSNQVTMCSFGSIDICSKASGELILLSVTFSDAHGPSSVFREMLGIGRVGYTSTQSSPLELTDDTFENSHTVRIMLDAIYAVRVDKPLDGYMPYLVPAVQLMKKYECNTGLENLRLNLRIWGADVKITAKFDIFAAAAHLEDVDTCCLTIHRGGSLRSSTPGKLTAWGNTADLNVSVTTTNTFDVAGWSQAELDRMPKKYTLALLRATKGYDLALVGDVHGWYNISEAFRAFVTTSESK